MASSPPSETEIINRGLHAIKRLPLTRMDGKIAPPPSLRDLLRLINFYLASPSKKTPPPKTLLLDAVQSLMPPPQHLSSQWNKTHLSLVLRKWVLSALRLENYNDQANLCIQIKRQQGKGRDPYFAGV